MQTSAVNDLAAIDLTSVRMMLGDVTFARAVDYARKGRVREFLWDPDQQQVSAVVAGSQRGGYLTTVQLIDTVDDCLGLAWSECTCPMTADCKHVAATLLVAAGSCGRGSARRPRAATPPPSWRSSLDGLLPPPTPAPQLAQTPIAIELSVAEPAPHGRQPSLRARLVRPGKRGGWVAGDLSWSRLEYQPSHYRTGAPVPTEQLRVAQQLLGAYRVSRSAPSQYGGSHAYDYGDLKSLPLSEMDSRHLWPLLEEAVRTGIRLVPAPPGHGDIRLSAPAVLQLDVRCVADGFAINPVLRVPAASTGGQLADQQAIRATSSGPEVRPVLFLGASGYGVVFADPADPQRIQLAPLARQVPNALQRLALTGDPLHVPAAETAGFIKDYYPTLRRLAEIVSSDGTFTPPTVAGPELVVRADFLPYHQVDVELEWVYRLQHGTRSHEQVIRVPLGHPATGTGIRDIAAEQDLAVSIDAPLERFGLRDADGALLERCALSGLATMQLATELLPLLDGLDAVTVERSGELVDYREAGDSLVISVSADDIPGETDWFDLGVNISVEGVQIPFVTVFSALAAGESHLLRPDGAYFALDKPELVRLRTLIEEARSLTDAADAPLRISRFQAGLFDELATLGVVERQAEQWRQQVAGLRAVVAVEQAESAPGLAATLRGYQAEGFSWLATLHANGLGGILADDMGLGKTVQALALLCRTRQADASSPPFLAVAPSSVVSNWVTEARRFAPGLRVVALPDTLRRSGTELAEVVQAADLVLTSYTVFRLDFESYAAYPWSGLILDEAQYVKNRQAKTYQCVRKLPAPFKLAITGTPMENNLMELWALLSITAPGLFPNPTAFNEYFARPIERSGDVERLDTFRRRIKPLVKRRTKELVAADLPAKQEQLVELDLHPRHRKLYDQRLQRERQKVLGLLDDVNRNRFTILKSLTTLRQLALHPGLVDPAWDAVPCAKIDQLVEQLHDVAGGGHRALVFSQFTRFLGRVRKRLDAEEVGHTYLDGRTRNRPTVIERFKTGADPVFLISLKAGGFGLNLTEADYCFLLDPWWNPATEMQAIDRTHRIGQTRNVMVYRMISAGTIEDKVAALNTRKAELFTSVLDDGNAFGSALSADDIRGLLD